MTHTPTRTMIHLTSEDREEMYRNGSTVRVWYQKRDTREEYHIDFKTLGEANEHNKQTEDTIKQFTIVGRRKI